METKNDQIKTMQDELAEVVGGELADSLIRAGRKRGEFDLDMQLAINDGLATLPAHKRTEALALIDSMIEAT